MLKRYKMVSIIYGGSGAVYAKGLRDMIDERSEAERYPIAARIVMESVLTGDLLASITDLFTTTQFCVAILTADDVCLQGDKRVCRVRQNVLFELGMAVYRLGRERCILLSDFDPRDGSIELPSDLKGMDIKYFNAETREEVFSDVLNKILALGALEEGELPRYDGLLDRSDYFVNYSDLFASCSHIDSREGTTYLQGVLDFWMAESKSFRHYEEKCLYYLERMAFLPMFGRHRWVNDWLLEMEGELAKYKQADILSCGKRKLSFMHDLAFVVSAIMRLKLRDAEPTKEEYTELLDRMAFADAEESGVKNPLALTVYYDYLGLLHLSLFDLGESVSHLEEAIACFKKILDEYVEHTDMNLGIWEGFVGYNIARCYLKRYHLTKDEADAKRAQKQMLRASMVRKGWLSQTDFHVAIRSALSYEYFICKLEQISSMKLLDSRSDEQTKEEFKRLEGELESYMIRDEQLERLRFVQSLLVQRQQEIVAEDAIAEKLL